MAERKLADWLKTFVDWASFGEAPLSMLFWTGVATIAGAVRRRLWINMRIFEWVPNFYIILVAPPGVVTKSSTINMGMQLLREIPGINFGPDIATWQAVVSAFRNAQESVLCHADGNYYPMSCITVASDELGNFISVMDQSLINLLISLWDGKKGSLSKLTKTAGYDHVENPLLNFIGCTTPSWIAENFTENTISGGFTSRCVFVYADKKRQYVAFPDENAPREYEETRAKLLHDLEIISQLIGEMKLPEETRQLGRAWYENHWKSAHASTLNNEQFAGYLARKYTHVIKLSMILSVSEADDLTIHPHHFSAAAELISALEESMPKIYQRIGQTDVTKGALDLVEIVQRVGSINRSDLYRLLFKSLTYKDFDVSLASAVQAGHVKLVNRNNSIFVESTKDERES